MKSPTINLLNNSIQPSVLWIVLTLGLQEYSVRKWYLLWPRSKHEEIMGRRQYMSPSPPAGTGLVAPRFGTSTIPNSEQDPLILHTETIRPYEPLHDPDIVIMHLHPGDNHDRLI